MSTEIKAVTHTEKVIAGEVDAVTHLEQVIAKYGGGGGGGGFTPTDAQLAAMNSGITQERLETDETNISTVQQLTTLISSETHIVNIPITWTAGYVALDGTVYASNTYCYGSIAVNEGEIVTLYRDNSGVLIETARFICCKKNGVAIPEKGATGELPFVVPEGVDEIVLSVNIGYKDYNSYASIPRTTYGERIPNISFPDANMLISNLGFGLAKAEKANMSDGEKLIIEKNSIKNNCVIKFYTKITSFGSVIIGHNDTGTYQESFEIDDTNVYYIVGNNRTPVAHNLTIAEYLSVVVEMKNDSSYTITIDTLGGRFERTTNSGFQGTKGDIFAISNESTLYNVSLTWNANYQRNKWVFGDSYISMSSNKRWAYYIINAGYNNTLWNGYPGEGASDAYADFITALSHGLPKYVIWCIGMNNGDTSTAINSTWKKYTELVIDKCQEKGINLILSTTPNTPTVNNVFKNAYVKASGFRYIDFAEAVGAEEVNSTWITGCLDTDNVHPTENGARLLYSRALQDFPEFMQD